MTVPSWSCGSNGHRDVVKIADRIVPQDAAVESKLPTLRVEIERRVAQHSFLASVDWSGRIPELGGQRMYLRPVKASIYNWLSPHPFS
jgi:hypothetical protein